MVVVVTGELVEPVGGVSPAIDEDLVGAFLPDRAYEPFRVAVRPRGLRRVSTIWMPSDANTSSNDWV
jgi:hypothetical protein